MRDFFYARGKVRIPTLRQGTGKMPCPGRNVRLYTLDSAPGMPSDVAQIAGDYFQNGTSTTPAETAS